MIYSRISMILGAGAAVLIWSSGVRAQAAGGPKTITEADCTAAKLGDSIDAAAIGEPVSAVTLSEPRWNAAGKGGGPYCTVNGAIAPVDKSPNAKPINFSGGAASGVEWALGAVGRRRDERNDSGLGRASN